MNYTFAQYKESADYIRGRIGGFAPKVAMVLGSGLGYMGDIAVFMTCPVVRQAGT